MKRSAKSLLNITLILCIIFTMTVGVSSQTDIVLANQVKDTKSIENDSILKQITKLTDEELKLKEQSKKTYEELLLKEEETTLTEEELNLKEESKLIYEELSLKEEKFLLQEEELKEENVSLEETELRVNKSESNTKKIEKETIDSIVQEETKEEVQNDETVEKELKEEQKVNIEEILEEPLEESSEEELLENISIEKNEIAENYPTSNTSPRLVFPKISSQQLVSSRVLTDTIKVNKTAKEAPGCRTFEVTLGITGTPPVNPVDVVLVIDRSGSMNISFNNIEITGNPDTSKNYFVLTDQGYQQISRYSGSGNSAIWRYGGSGARRYVKFDPNSDDSGAGGGKESNAIGKKFYTRVEVGPRIDFAKQAAGNFAAKVLGPDGVPGNRVSIVSFSGPTVTSGSGSQTQASTDQTLTNNLALINNAIEGITTGGGTNTEAGFLQAKNEITSAGSKKNPDSNKVVIMFTDGLPTASNGNKYAESTDIKFIHNQQAIKSGKSLFGVTDVFTVGLLQGMTSVERNLAIEILEQANNKKFYEAPTAADLDGIFGAISENLGYSAKDAVVVDEIGKNFKPVLPLPLGATYDEATNKITWDAGSLGNIKEYKYNVKAIPTFEGGSAFTNEEAILTYTDVNKTTNRTKIFPKPKVDVPTALSVTLSDTIIKSGESIALGSGTDPNGENYMAISGGGSDGVGPYTYEWRVKGKSSVISTVKSPEVNPLEDTIYELTLIGPSGCIAKDEMKVKVLNKQSFRIKKVDKDTGDLLDGAEFILKKGDNIITTVRTNNGYALLENIPIGSYILKETRAPSEYRINDMNYAVEVLNNGNITLKSNSYINVVEENGIKVIVIKNEKSAVLPNTGGPGSIHFIIIGISLILISLFYIKKDIFKNI